MKNDFVDYNCRKLQTSDILDIINMERYPCIFSFSLILYLCLLCTPLVPSDQFLRSCRSDLPSHLRTAIASAILLKLEEWRHTEEMFISKKSANMNVMMSIVSTALFQTPALAHYYLPVTYDLDFINMS